MKSIHHRLFYLITTASFVSIESLVSLFSPFSECINTKNESDYMKNILQRISVIEVVNFRGCNMNNLDDFLKNSKNLRSLDLSENNFTVESVAKINMKSNRMLQYFILSKNRQNLTTVPSNFFHNLTYLMTIDLSLDGLIKLPNDLLLNMTYLSSLNLMGNQLNELSPEFFAKCYNLFEVNLSFNRIDILYDNNFGKSLKVLNLSHNFLKIIGDNDFKELFQLRKLDLSHNQLIDIHPSGLLDLKRLRKANFSFNNLTLEAVRTNNNPRESLFDKKNVIWFKNLKEFDVSHNKIKKLPVPKHVPKAIMNFAHNEFTIFEISAKSLRWAERMINLSSNKIISIKLPADDFSYTTKPITIILENNPFSCDCNFYELLQFREGKILPKLQTSIDLNFNDVKCHNRKIIGNPSIEVFNTTSFKCFVEQPDKYGADCPSDCDCWIRQYDKAYIVDCAYRQLEVAPHLLKSPKGYFIELNLTGNSLRAMPILNNQSGYEAVQVILLSHNQIEHVPSERLSTQLRYLDLSFNNLTKLEDRTLDLLSNLSQLKHLELHNNPWICNCDSIQLYYFIQTMVVNFTTLQKVKCPNSGKSIFKINPYKLCQFSVDPLGSTWIIVGSISVALVGLLMGIVVSLYHYYQNEIKVWLYHHQLCLKFITDEELDKDKEFDAFISYSHKDESFVVDNLMSRLEDGPRPFKLCVHYRDFIGGESIAEQIVRAIESSRRTIIVLSPNFLDSTWSRMEFKTAHAQALSEGRIRVVVIIYHDVGPVDRLDDELRAYLNTNTYIKWGDPWFWRKLMYAMPHSESLFVSDEKRIASQLQNGTVANDGNSIALNEM